MQKQNNINSNEAFCVFCGSYDIICKISVIVDDEIRFIFLCKDHMKNLFSENIEKLFDMYDDKLDGDVFAIAGNENKFSNKVQKYIEKNLPKMAINNKKNIKSNVISVNIEKFYTDEGDFTPTDIYINLKNKKPCSECGYTFNDIVFQFGGVFGCQYCYRNFKNDIKNFIQKYCRKLKFEENKIIIKNVKFFADMSKMKIEKEKIESLVEKYKIKKNLFVKNENFLKAIELRNIIKVNENKILSLNNKIKSIEKSYQNFIERTLLK